MIDWMKYRVVYFLISAIVIGAGIFAYAKWGLSIGIDFKGGSTIEYQFEKDVSAERLQELFKATQFSTQSLEKTSERVYTIKSESIDALRKNAIRAYLQRNLEMEITELRFENVGPSIGPELIKKTFFAMGIAAAMILLWIAIQFKSIKFGVSAVLAMLHDSLVLLGVFAIMGHFLGAEVDFLFVTAMLTILSFSVHDTIVVYDRIRESQKKYPGSMRQLANKAVTETMVRSLNNSFTIIFMLVALILLGGTTIKWFAVALLIGTISGTYSSPFVAVPILVTWDEIVAKIKKRRTP